MSGRQVYVTALEGDLEFARAVAERLRSAGSREPRLRFDVAAAEEVQERGGQAEAVVFIAPPAHRDNSVFTLLSSLEETGVPVIALIGAALPPGNPYEFTGAFIQPREFDPSALIAQLQGMLHRQNVVSRLMEEVALARRFHGGLEGQIAKMHEELQLAAIVQREFLPRELPSLHGVSFAAMWRPTNYVSGDIYDVIRLDEDHLGVFIADAVGHGVPAALMTMVITRSLNTKDVQEKSYSILEPSEVLSRLNAEMIRRQGRSTRFATACYAVVNCRSREMKLAGAGHPPPLLLGADDSVRLLETQGGLLGVFADETYSQIEVELRLDDTMLMYSDGFEQAFPAEAVKTLHGRKMPTLRYRDEFARLASFRTPDAMIQRISRRLDDQCGSLHQLDDLTLICMRAGPLLQQPTDSHATPQVHAAPVQSVAIGRAHQL